MEVLHSEATKGAPFPSLVSSKRIDTPGRRGLGQGEGKGKVKGWEILYVKSTEVGDNLATVSEGGQG